MLLTREWSDWRDGVFWWIQSVYIVPEARGGGVYRAPQSSGGSACPIRGPLTTVKRLKPAWNPPLPGSAAAAGVERRDERCGSD